MKEKEKKTNSKNAIRLVKISTIILLIILVSMIGFLGIYSQNKNQIANKVKDYTYSMSINGARNIKLKLNTETTEVIKDSEGNIIDEATDEEIEEKGYVKEEVPNNKDEAKTEENYNIAKNVIEKRLKKLGVQEYNISLNEKTGEMIIEIPENTTTDTIISRLNTVGKFEIIDSDTKDVLLDNTNIKESNVLYNTETTGTSVYLEIAFNKEGKKKLEEISKSYIKIEENDTTDEENNTEETENVTDNEITENNTNEISENETTENTKTTEKKITMKIDDEEIMTTSFDEPITNGKIQLSVGQATTDSKTLQDYITQAQNVATVLDSGNLPIKYDIEKNQYILSDITEQELGYIAIAILAIAFVGIVVLIIKFRTNGLLAGIAYIGLTATYLLLIRYTNVIISIESIFGIAIMLILNYIFTFMLLNNIKIKEDKENIVNKSIIETYTKFFIRIIPICIMTVAFCFIKWIPISSFGMISFWGLALIAIYNAVITRNLLKIKSEKI